MTRHGEIDANNATRRVWLRGGLLGAPPAPNFLPVFMFFTAIYTVHHLHAVT